MSSNILIVILSFIIVGIIFVFVISTTKSKIRKVGSSELIIGDIIPQDGISVPVAAGFWGPNEIMAIGHNNLNPLLILYPDQMILRTVFFKSTKKYSNIEKISITERLGTENINFYFSNGSKWVESLNLGSRDHLREIIKFFEQKGVSLSPEAQNLIK